MMKVQEFIKQYGVMALANPPLNIKVREYPEQGYFMLNYDQIESPKNNELTIECRSLIVDKDLLQKLESE
jgi:predicted RNase H-like nuclease